MPCSVRVQALRCFSIESEVDDDIGKRWSAECRVRFGYRHYDASRPNLKLMTILASGGQPNAVFGSGFKRYNASPIEFVVDSRSIQRI